MSRPGRILPPRKIRYPLYRRLGGTQGRSGKVRKISTATGIRSPDRPAHRQSLYRLRYPVHSEWKYIGKSVKGSGHGLTGCTVSEFIWIDCGKRLKSSFMTTRFPAMIQTGYHFLIQYAWPCGCPNASKWVHVLVLLRVLMNAIMRKYLAEMGTGICILLRPLKVLCVTVGHKCFLRTCLMDRHCLRC